MRIFMKVVFPNEPFNSYVRDGSANKKLKRVLDKIAPETVYFTEIEGMRTMLAFVTIAKDSRIPSLAEPLFLLFDAKVEMHVAMNAVDLQKAKLTQLGKEWGEEWGEEPD